MKGSARLTNLIINALLDANANRKQGKSLILPSAWIPGLLTLKIHLGLCATLSGTHCSDKLTHNEVSLSLLQLICDSHNIIF